MSERVTGCSQERDVRQAFAEAAEGKPVVLAITNHDFRDMEPDIDAFRQLVTRVAAISRRLRFSTARLLMQCEPH